MARFKLTIEYDGTPYAGWQRQQGLPTVQGTLEAVLKDFLEESVEVFGSGRTDAGVHAAGQVAHVDIIKPYTAFAIQGALNQRLLHVPISILKVEEVSDLFHARFSATSRCYVYKILNRRAEPTFDRNRVWWVIPSLCTEKMIEGAQFLLGNHDFSAFRGSHCQAASPWRTLDALHIDRRDDLILIKARARSFLHHQVRNIVGTLKHVGEGRWKPEKIADILASCDRRQAGQTAPACGLYLNHIAFSK